MDSFLNRSMNTGYQNNANNAYNKPLDPSIKQNNIDDILKERGERYGKFTDHAAISQGLKAVMRNTPKWRDLSPDKKEALEMIAHKVARLLNGDSSHKDGWFDIAGYSKLVADTLEG
tara:strand:+ start:132 stop:482 length:351 start_codon:yes stop_codon:yes gene_type:complete